MRHQKSKNIKSATLKSENLKGKKSLISLGRMPASPDPFNSATCCKRELHAQLTWKYCSFKNRWMPNFEFIIHPHILNFTNGFKFNFSNPNITLIDILKKTKLASWRFLIFSFAQITFLQYNSWLFDSSICEIYNLCFSDIKHVQR